jgi:hypothetical protein
MAPLTAWCFICDEAVDGDLPAHMEEVHPATIRKVRTAKIAWQDRITNVIDALHKIQVSEDRAAQIEQLDEDVIKELYLVRHRLAQLKGTPVMRVKEGS